MLSQLLMLKQDIKNKKPPVDQVVFYFRKY